MNLLPRLFVTRPLPAAVEARLCSVFDVQLNKYDHPLEAQGLAFATRRNDAILATITDRIDSRLLLARDVTVRIVANFGAGIDHIDLAAAKRAGIIVTNTPKHSAGINRR